MDNKSEDLEKIKKAILSIYQFYLKNEFLTDHLQLFTELYINEDIWIENNENILLLYYKNSHNTSMLIGNFHTHYQDLKFEESFKENGIMDFDFKYLISLHHSCEDTIDLCRTERMWQKKNNGSSSDRFSGQYQTNNRDYELAFRYFGFIKFSDLTFDDVKKAYKEKAKEFHSDVNKNKSDELMKDCNVNYLKIKEYFDIKKN